MTNTRHSRTDRQEPRSHQDAKGDRDGADPAPSRLQEIRSTKWSRAPVRIQFNEFKIARRRWKKKQMPGLEIFCCRLRALLVEWTPDRVTKTPFR